MDDHRGESVSRVLNTDPVTIGIRYALPARTPGMVVGIGVLAGDGTTVFTTNTNDGAVRVPDEVGEYDASVTIPGDVLLIGDYHVALCIWDHAAIFDLQEPALSFSVVHGPSVVYALGIERKGFVHIACSWTMRERAFA